MHITLHFFGEIPEAKIPEFSSFFDDPGLQRPAIQTRLGGVGAFPPAGHPRVLWVGLKEGADEMQAFCKLLTEKIQPLRRPDGPLCDWLPDARPFFAHITVARSGSTRLEAPWMREVQVPPADFLITECVLFQSVLGGGSARNGHPPLPHQPSVRYIPLSTIHFQRGAA
jgi:2'-5' RNA ligase